MIRVFQTDLKFRYGGLYAVVVATDDYLENQDIADLILFESKEDYDDWISNANDIQIHTGLSWHTFYKKES